MAKILFIHPNKQGHGVTAIWIPSHSAVLKSKGHQVQLFDCTFYKDWTVNETQYNTDNLMYKPSDYSNYINFSENNVFDDLQAQVDEYNPDVIFWAAL